MAKGRWKQVRIGAWELRAAQKDGAGVLATIARYGLDWKWDAAGKSGIHRSFMEAKLAARRALREGVVTAEQE
jgi:hypothetical protein